MAEPVDRPTSITHLFRHLILGEKKAGAQLTEESEGATAITHAPSSSAVRAAKVSSTPSQQSGPNEEDAETHVGSRFSVPLPTNMGYELREHVATGGCGEVWAAMQSVFPRLVALKRIRMDLLSTSSRQERDQFLRGFLQESFITAILEHPAIVPVYDFSIRADGSPALTMRIIRGQRWDTMIGEDIAMPVAEYLEKHLPILISVTQAVAFAHSRGIIHRDLKPSQVMIGEFGEVYLMDWGLALIFDEKTFYKLHPQLPDKSILPLRTSMPPLGGTPAYMAPEQRLYDLFKLTPLTDVYLLGSTFYHMLTGRPPHRAASSSSSMEMPPPPAPPRELLPDLDIPEELNDICMRALREKPEERFGSVREFLEALQHYMSGATKRRDSQDLTDKAFESFVESEGDYLALADCESMLSRALGLWPQNRRAERIRQQVLMSFAESALTHDDLVLAETHAMRLSHPQNRESILNEVKALRQLKLMAHQEMEDAEQQLRNLRVSGEETQSLLVATEFRLEQTDRLLVQLLETLETQLSLIRADRTRTGDPTLHRGLVLALSGSLGRRDGMPYKILQTKGPLLQELAAMLDEQGTHEEATRCRSLINSEG